MPLYLASHVHSCLAGGQLVLLDVRRDEYMGLGGADARALAPHVIGWPTIPAMDANASTSSEQRVRRLLEQFRAKGMITATPPPGRHAPVSAPEVQSSLVHECPGVRPRAHVRDVAQLLIASIRAVSRLRRDSLESTLEHVRRRKHGAMCSRFARGIDSGGDVSAWVGAFLYARPLFYRSRNNCLLDSLALIEYLAARRVYPTWVWGVRIAPFGAHCWVQEGPVVFNDSPEHVRRYSPILSV